MSHRKKSQILKFINEAIINGQRSGLTLEEQLDLMYSKAELYLFLKGT